MFGPILRLQLKSLQCTIPDLQWSRVAEKNPEGPCLLFGSVNLLHHIEKTMVEQQHLSASMLVIYFLNIYSVIYHTKKV